MSKTYAKKSVKKSFYISGYFVAFVCVVVLIVVAFVFRGWIRVTVIPKALATHYGSNVESTLGTEISTLKSPLAKLGYAPSSTHTSCALQQAQNIHTEVDCTAELHVYTLLPTNAGEAAIESNAQTIQRQLQENGWHSGSNGVTLTSLVDGTYQGKDYSADAYYEKVVGATDCVFDTMIAYANPQPAAISSTFSCARTINILGSPSDEVYNSSKGTPAY